MRSEDVKAKPIRRGLRLPTKQAWLQISLPIDRAEKNAGVMQAKSWSLVFCGAALSVFSLFGAVVGSRVEHREESLPDDVFFIEDQVPQPPSPEPPPPLPPASDPDRQPPPEPDPAIKPEDLPPPQFGLTEETLGEAGELAVAAGNTLMTSADTVVLPPPPPLPTAPQMLDQPPSLVKGEAPQYPARALDLGLEGTVVALITIDTLGAVTDVVIEKSAGRDLDQAVLRASLATTFRAPVRQGRKVGARFRRPYEFRLE
jgi:TonB family protein